MKLINPSFTFLDTYDSNNPKAKIVDNSITSAALAIQSSNFLDEEVWYCMLTTEYGLKKFDIKKLIGRKVFERIIKKEVTLVFDCSFEPFLKIIDAIYEEVVIKHNVPSSQIVFITNMYDAHNYNNEVVRKLNQPSICILWFSALEFMAKEYLTTEPNTLETKEYNKKFLNLNRRWRSHRPLLVLLLKHRNLLDKGFVSFGPCEDHTGNWDKVWHGLKSLAYGNTEMTDAIKESDSIRSMPPLYLDTDNLHVNHVELTDATKKFYRDSYFSIVSETTFFYKHKDQNSRFITEKTFKAIAMKHPFIIVSLPKSLDVLKHLGYKTFSPWIDESYDLEYDDNKRMMMIVNEIERLSNLSPSDLEHFLVAMREISSYNYNVLQNKKEFIYGMR